MQRSLDDLLECELAGDWRGGFGPAQWLVLIAAGISYVSMGCVMFLMSFTTAPSSSWSCADPVDAACAAVWHRTRRDGMAGGPADGVGSWDPHAFCSLAPSQYVWADASASVDTEFDLLCGQAWKASALQTAFFAGFMLGNAVFGSFADRHGRRMTLLLCAAATAGLTALSASPLVAAGPGVRRGAAAAGTAPYGSGYWVHLVLRTASGSACAGQALGAYVLATEMVGPAWRGAAGMGTQTFYILGEFILVGLSLALPPWRRLTLAVALCCALVLLLAALLPESPRWLLLQGRTAEAHAALLWVMRCNRCRRVPRLACTASGEVLVLPPAHEALELARAARAPAAPHKAAAYSPPARCGSDIEKAGAALLLAESSSSSSSSSSLILVSSSSRRSTEACPAAPGGCGVVPAPCCVLPPPALVPGALEGGTCAPASRPAVGAEPGMLAAVAHPVTRRLLLGSCFTMFSLSVAYFGITLVASLSGSRHLNFFLAAAAELPGYLAIAATTGRLGRRAVIGGGTALASIACLACALTPAGPLQVVLAMAGKLGCSGAWAMGLTYSAELFPTSLRSKALALASQSGDLGGLFTPLLLFLGQATGTGTRLPFALMAALAALSAALVWQLPETRGMPQLDTFEELIAWLRAHGHAAVDPQQRCDAATEGARKCIGSSARSEECVALVSAGSIKGATSRSAA